MPKSENRQDIIFGMALLGGTGLLIGLILDSYMLTVLAGGLGIIIGWFVGWLGGRRYLLIVCLGIVLGAALGYSTGDRDIVIMATGSGAAIAGFLAAPLELFLGKK